MIRGGLFFCFCFFSLCVLVCLCFGFFWLFFLFVVFLLLFLFVCLFCFCEGGGGGRGGVNRITTIENISVPILNKLIGYSLFNNRFKLMKFLATPFGDFMKSLIILGIS